MKVNQQVEVPEQINPAARELLTREWTEGNISGGTGGGDSTLPELLAASGSTLTLTAGNQLIRYGRATIEGTLIINGLVVIL